MKDAEYYRNLYIGIYHDRVSFTGKEVIDYKMTPIEAIAYYQLRLLQDGYGTYHFKILPQFEVENYKIDFLVVFSFPGVETVRLAIECDGHEFHEKTKQQASKDKRRDRQLQKYNYKVLRYSGSDIVNNPRIIAMDIVDLLPTDEDTKNRIKQKEG